MQYISRLPTCFAALVVVVALGTISVRAQPSFPDFGADPDSAGVGETLDLLMAYEIGYPDAGRVLVRVAESGDSTHIPRLKELVANLGEYYEGLSYVAFWAMGELGELEDYFLDKMRAYEQNEGLAYYAIWALARSPRTDLVPELEAIAALYPRGSHYNLRTVIADYTTLLRFEAAETEQTISERVHFYLIIMARSASATTEINGNLEIAKDDTGEYLDPYAVWARERLDDVARTYPTLVYDQVQAFAGDPRWVREDPYLGDTFVTSPEIVQLFVDHADETAFPVDAPPQPPVDTVADVLPLAECVKADTTSAEGSLLAYFGYDNRHGEAVTIPYGETSVITPSAYDHQQPEVYYMPQVVEGQPGRTPFYGDEDFHDWAFAVRFDSTETVSWTLGDRTVTVSSSWQRCEDYVPGWQDVTVLPAAATLASSSVEASFSGNSFLVSGLDHDLNGNTTGSGEDRHGIAVADETGRQSVLDALSSNQEGNVTGQDPAPDIAVAAPGLDVEDLVDGLLARADLITLDADPGNQTVGSASAPVVAYAPDGLDVQGTFEGYGILVVEGTFEEAAELKGNAAWTGLVIVSAPAGAPAAFDMSGNVEVIGAVVLQSDTGAVLDVGGSSSIRYSAEALGLAQSLLDAP